MEDIFNSLNRDYALAMENYGKGEFTYYFRNIRPALEWLCKLVIADQLDGKCNPSDIFNGVKTIRRSGSDYSMQSGTGKALRGRQLMETMFASFMYKRKDVRDARLDEHLKGLRESMEMFSHCIRRFYSVASTGNHSADHIDDVKAIATKYASILSDFISFLVDQEILKNDNASRLKTLTPVKVIDEREIASIVEEKKLISEQLIKQKNELEAAFRQAEDYKSQQEAAIRQSEVTISEKERRIQELEEEIERIKTASSVRITARPITPPAKRSGSDLELADDKIDFDQEDVILAADDQSLIVCGCAGSGKSVIAMKKAKALHEAGEDVITIAYTKSLNDYMRSGIQTDIGKFYYHYQWEKAGCPSADYLIVDEIQDFTGKEIMAFINAAKKHFFFFGDSAQSIFAPFRPGCLDMNKIADLTGLQPMILYTNYRLPRPVARITQGYIGVDVEPYSGRTYINESAVLPHIVRYEDRESQVFAVAEFIESNPDKSIGIFLPNNSSVLEFCNSLSLLGVSFEFKYEFQKANGKKSGYKPCNTLDFTNLAPKVMTYHSAKGLQFQAVVLPWFDGASSVDERKALYVAMTRTQAQLIITYSGDLKSPLNNVPEILYKKNM